MRIGATCAIAALLTLLLCVACVADQVAVTRTPEELDAAIRQHTPHIVIADHLDLRPLVPQSGRQGELVLFVVPKAVRSITANCTQAPPAELPLRDFALPQCVLQVAACVTPFRFNFPDAAAWLHALHIYSAPNPAGAEASELLTFRGVRSDFWLTAVNLQGGGGLVRGIQADSTRTFIWGSTFSGLRAGIGPAFWLEDSQVYSTTAFESVVFANSSATGEARSGCDDVRSGLVYVSVKTECDVRTGVTLRNCTFQDTVGAAVHRRVRTHDVFADTPLSVVDTRGECDEDYQDAPPALAPAGAPDSGAMDYADAPHGGPDYGDGDSDYNDGYDACEQAESTLQAFSRYPKGSPCRRAADLYEEADFACPLDAVLLTVSRPYDDLATAQTPWKPQRYLHLRSPELLRIQQARDEAIRSDPAAQAALAAAARGPVRETFRLDGYEDTIPVGAVVGGVLGGVLGLAALAALCACVAIRLRRRGGAGPARKVDMEAASQLQDGKSPPAEYAQSPRPSTYASVNTAFVASGSASGSGPPAPTSSASGLGVRTQRSSQYNSTSWPTNVSVTRPLLSSQPTTLASLDDVRSASHADASADALEDVLDDMHESGETFAHFFMVHSHFFRRRGGQGLVQFMQREQNEEEVAVKFFLSHSAFERELGYYSDPKLRGLLVPVVHHAGDDDGGGVRTRSDYRFPPFIVVERGESLNEWVSRVAPDLPTTIFVLLHLAQKLERIHSHGLCHRDIKPSNVLFLPGANAWTLMDFGCAAPIGERAHLAFSPHYAAPETIAAAEAGASGVVVSAALDMWALGVIAYELLTTKRTFAPPVTERQVWDQLAGRAPLPWERPGAQAELAAQLKALRRSVLKCLERNPELRPTSRELLGAWNGMFESMTGCTTDEYVVPERRRAS